MIPCLKKIYSVIANKINNAVLLCEASRPSAGQKVFERFWLADASEWIAHYCFNQIKSPQRYFSVSLHPMTQVFTELWLKNSVPLFSLQGQPQSEAISLKMLCQPPSEHVPAQKEAFRHFWENASGESFPPNFVVHQLQS